MANDTQPPPRRSVPVGSAVPLGSSPSFGDAATALGANGSARKRKSMSKPARQSRNRRNRGREKRRKLVAAEAAASQISHDGHKHAAHPDVLPGRRAPDGPDAVRPPSACTVPTCPDIDGCPLPRPAASASKAVSRNESVANLLRRISGRPKCWAKAGFEAAEKERAETAMQAAPAPSPTPPPELEVAAVSLAVAGPTADGASAGAAASAAASAAVTVTERVALTGTHAHAAAEAVIEAGEEAPARAATGDGEGGAGGAWPDAGVGAEGRLENARTAAEEAGRQGQRRKVDKKKRYKARLQQRREQERAALHVRRGQGQGGGVAPEARQQEREFQDAAPDVHRESRHRYLNESQRNVSTFIAAPSGRQPDHSIVVPAATDVAVQISAKPCADAPQDVLLAPTANLAAAAFESACKRYGRSQLPCGFRLIVLGPSGVPETSAWLLAVVQLSSCEPKVLLFHKSVDAKTYAKVCQAGGSACDAEDDSCWVLRLDISAVAALRIYDPRDASSRPPAASAQGPAGAPSLPAGADTAGKPPPASTDATPQPCDAPSRLSAAPVAPAQGMAGVTSRPARAASAGGPQPSWTDAAPKLCDALSRQPAVSAATARDLAALPPLLARRSSSGGSQPASDAPRKPPAPGVPVPAQGSPAAAAPQSVAPPATAPRQRPPQLLQTVARLASALHSSMARPQR
jgi:hypothetical protein